MRKIMIIEDDLMTREELRSSDNSAVQESLRGADNHALQELRSGEIVPRADLIDALWDDHIYIDDNTLSVNVTRLRGKLAELGLPDYIKTRRGMGYQV